MPGRPATRPPARTCWPACVFPSTWAAPHQAGRSTGGKAYSSRAIRDHLRKRGIATRYEKAAAIYPAGLHLAGVFLRSTR
ncbi:hypothetical protein SHIRM173S_01219 [Streptomyces hirsutus]